MGLSDNYDGNAEYIKWDYKGDEPVEGALVGFRDYEGDDFSAPIMTLQEDGEALETSVAGFRSVLADKIEALRALGLPAGTRVEVVPTGQPRGKRYWGYDVFYQTEDGSVKKVFTPKKGGKTGAPSVGKIPF